MSSDAMVPPPTLLSLGTSSDQSGDALAERLGIRELAPQVHRESHQLEPPVGGDDARRVRHLIDGNRRT